MRFCKPTTSITLSDMYVWFNYYAYNEDTLTSYFGNYILENGDTFHFDLILTSCSLRQNLEPYVLL